MELAQNRCEWKTAKRVLLGLLDEVAENPGFSGPFLKHISNKHKDLLYSTSMLAPRLLFHALDSELVVKAFTVGPEFGKMTPYWCCKRV
jgi:hypothetical protein